MKLSVFVSALGWASIFCQTWLWLLGEIQMDLLRIGLYILFWLLALCGGAASLDGRRPEKKPPFIK